MKSAPFTYHRPNSVDEAATLLSEVHEEGGRVIAGGQSLIPMMALRVAYPSCLIDINFIPELDRIAVAKKTLTIGALARHAEFCRPVAPGPIGALLPKIASRIAHYPIRQRGTFCGSLAHADPASEWCLTVSTLNGSILVRSRTDQREIRAEDFFSGAMETKLEPQELITGVRIPLVPDDRVCGFYEFSRRAGDFAMGMCLVVLKLQDGVIKDVQLGMGGVEESPRRLLAVESELKGKDANSANIEEAASMVANTIVALEDEQISGPYRRSIASIVVKRALKEAVESKTDNQKEGRFSKWLK